MNWILYTLKERSMTPCIGIRLEDKNIWEARTPLIPEHLAALRETHEIEFVVQESPIRAFSTAEYLEANAKVSTGVDDCPVVLAIKEIPIAELQAEKTYLFFSHTIKGQPANMPMLRRLMELGCQLLDYERMVDEQGKRVVFFGNYAGLAGMIDTLWALGQRFSAEGIPTPFEGLRPALAYGDLETARQAISDVGAQIIREGLPEEITPLVCGFAGYGNVSRGAQEIFDLLPVIEVSPAELAQLKPGDAHHVVKVVFKEADIVEALDPQTPFALQDYYEHPEKYRSRFESYLPALTVLINGIFWTPRYPRLVTKAGLRTLFERALFEQATCPRLRVIGDISCDTEGAIECTMHATTPGSPVYVYDPITCEPQQAGADAQACTGRGVVILAVDNLPCELPRESSTHFSSTLAPYIPAIASADYTVAFEDADLPPVLKNAMILWHGELTPAYRYLEKHL